MQSLLRTADHLKIKGLCELSEHHRDETQNYLAATLAQQQQQQQEQYQQQQQPPTKRTKIVTSQGQNNSVRSSHQQQQQQQDHLGTTTQYNTTSSTTVNCTKSVASSINPMVRSSEHLETIPNCETTIVDSDFIGANSRLKLARGGDGKPRHVVISAAPGGKTYITSSASALSVADIRQRDNSVKTMTSLEMNMVSSKTQIVA